MNTLKEIIRETGSYIFPIIMLIMALSSIIYGINQLMEAGTQANIKKEANKKIEYFECIEKTQDQNWCYDKFVK